MTASARLVATLAAPLASGDTDAPYVEHWPGKRLLVQRGDTELVVRDLDQPATESGEAVQVHFPAPWPRRFGGCAVAPTLDLVVFTGVHTLRAMDRTGAVRWEIRHRCWADMGRQPHGTHGTGTHESYDEYADSRDHRHASSGSAGFSADGTLVRTGRCAGNRCRVGTRSEPETAGSRGFVERDPLPEGTRAGRPAAATAGRAQDVTGRRAGRAETRRARRIEQSRALVREPGECVHSPAPPCDRCPPATRAPRSAATHVRRRVRSTALRRSPGRTSPSSRPRCRRASRRRR